MNKNWILGIGVVVLLVIAGYFVMKNNSGGGAASTSVTPTPSQEAVSPTAIPAVSTTSAQIVMTKTNATKGDYLSDVKGMTIYIFDKDTAGISTCYSACATLWPPYLEGATPPSTMSANITIVKRTDGSMQYAYKGMPVYYYSPDKKTGDVLGDGVGGVWHLVKP